MPKDKPLHVLFIPSWYRSDDIPANGGMFFDYAKFMAKMNHKSGVIYCDMLSLKQLSLKKLRTHRF